MLKNLLLVLGFQFPIGYLCLDLFAASAMINHLLTYLCYLCLQLICYVFLGLLGKFRHLPVVENGEVIALLDITKCLYDAISRMEKAAEQGSAIAAAVEGVERQFGSNLSG